MSEEQARYSTSNNIGQFEPLEDLVRLLKAIKTAQEILQEHEAALLALVETEQFKEVMRVLKEAHPESWENLRRVILGV
jgi:hypothetical protein